MAHLDEEVMEEDERVITNIDLTDVAKYWAVTLTEGSVNEEDELLALCYLTLFDIVKREWKLDTWSMTNVTNLSTKDH